MRPYCEWFVVRIQRGRRSGQPNGDITNHCVGAWKTEVDRGELAGGTGHGRLERKLEKEIKVKSLGERGAREGKVAEGENELPLSNSGIEAEVKSGVGDRFRNPLWPFCD